MPGVMRQFKPDPDRMLFGMPSDYEMFLAALAAVQDYQHQQERQVELKAKDPDYTIHIYIPPGYGLEYLKPAFGKDVKFVDEYRPNRTDYDLAVTFNPESGYRLSEAGQRHASQAFGVQIGSDPESLPDLSAVSEEVDPLTQYEVLLMNFPCRKAIADRIDEKNSRIAFCDGMSKFFGDELTGMGPIDFRTIVSSKMIVGYRGPATYVASCFRRQVVELYPNDVHRKWLAKWRNPNYQMLYGKEFSAEKIWSAMETLWHRGISESGALTRHGAFKEEIQMVRQRSSVASAADLSVGEGTPT